MPAHPSSFATIRRGVIPRKLSFRCLRLEPTRELPNSSRLARQLHLEVCGQGFLDETHRELGKVDRKDLCMDFHPYELGVVDAISQTLLPGIMKYDDRRGHQSRECRALGCFG